jgi:hypothetical protein
MPKVDVIAEGGRELGRVCPAEDPIDGTVMRASCGNQCTFRADSRFCLRDDVFCAQLAILLDVLLGFVFELSMIETCNDGIVVDVCYIKYHSECVFLSQSARHIITNAS